MYLFKRLYFIVIYYNKNENLKIIYKCLVLHQLFKYPYPFSEHFLYINITYRALTVLAYNFKTIFYDLSLCL